MDDDGDLWFLIFVQVTMLLMLCAQMDGI